MELHGTRSQKSVAQLKCATEAQQNLDLDFIFSRRFVNNDFAHQILSVTTRKLRQNALHNNKTESLNFRTITYSNEYLFLLSSRVFASMLLNSKCVTRHFNRFL